MFASRSTIHPPWQVFVAVLLVGLGCLLMSAVALAQGTTLKISAGVGSGTVAGNAYAPGDVTVQVGDSVTWTISSDEPHTITFGKGPANAPPPLWPVAGFTAPPPGPPKPINAGTVDFDGTQFLNTGIIFKGSTATVHFTKPGDYNFFCAIHPGMAGVVHVVAAGQPTTSQADADAKASQTRTQLLGLVDSVRSKALQAVASAKQGDGTTRWDIFANAITNPGPLPGGGTGYLELTEFIPPDLSITAGDTVRWIASAPHTVTFVPPGQDFHALGDPVMVPPAKPSTAYDGHSLYNSGVFFLGPNAPKDFSLTFPQAGKFSYLCLLHADQGQRGTITVAARAVLPGLPKTGGAPEWILWLLAGIGGALVVGGGALALLGRQLPLRRERA